MIEFGSNDFYIEEWINGIHYISSRPKLNNIIILEELTYQFRSILEDTACSAIRETALFLIDDDISTLKSNNIKLKRFLNSKIAEGCTRVNTLLNYQNHNSLMFVAYEDKDKILS